MAQELDSEWHAIRPWSRRISLQVREVTSVSVTFILKSSMGASRSEALAAMGVDSDEEEDIGRMPTISDALGRGLAVKVNGNHWQRVVVHVDEDEEEAIVIVYGLLPRKKYEIGLGIVASDDTISEDITTQPGPGDQATSNLPIANGTTHVPESAVSPSTLTPPTTPIRSSPPRPITPEERATQLRKQLALLTVERDELTSQLKLARRESQRTETALKSEIETLKRASEKHASGEHRSRQKVLALQEAVKQASAAAYDIEKMVRDIEETLPGLDERAREAQAVHNKVKGETDRKCAELDMVIQKDKKLLNELHGELTGVCAKLEKVTSKKEKLEKEVVPHLEEKLRGLQREIEEMQRTTPEYEDIQHDFEDINGPWNVRNWVPPIQRPSPQQSSNFPTHNHSSSIPAASSPSLPRHPSFRSQTRPPNFKSHANTALSPPLLPSYDPNFSLRNLPAQEEPIGSTGAAPSRVTSELKSGTTFHTPPRFQAQNSTHMNSSSSFDFVVQRPSPGTMNGEREQP
ncbi:hypothetical protein K439DRAFT_462541 [Ramaria rubella]|nr:hypothetical protein K439DRAFT_462541 [Ramaria rubella]